MTRRVASLVCRLISLTLLISVPAACRKKDSGSGSSDFVPQDALINAENQQLLIEVPEACEADSPVCESWLGIRDDAEGQVGLTHIKNRLVFSIEELSSDGTFSLAAYPDCNLDARIAAETEATVPQPVDSSEENPDAKPAEFRDWDVKADGELPPLGEAMEVVTAPADGDPETELVVVNEAPPFPECRKLVAPGAIGQPIQLLDPSLASESSRWRIELPEGGYPTFINATLGAEGKLRLLLGESGVLTTVNVDAGDDGLALLGFWKKLRGKLKKGFDSVEKGIADAKKAVGTNVNVAKLDGKKLFVTAALPAAKLYSAVKEQGPDALAKADGIAREGVVYMQEGARYAEAGAEAGLKGAKYIAEYVMANACYLGQMNHLISAFGSAAGSYELILAAGAKSFAEDLRDAFNVENMLKDKKSPTYLQVMVAVKAYALYASFVSKKFKLAQWEELLTDIIFSLLGGEVKQGFTPKIMSRVARAMCEGTDEALSSAHALVSTVSTSGIGEDCLEGIRSASMSRYEAGEDICYAMRAEIKKAAAAAPASTAVTSAWEAAGAHQACPKDAASEAYQNLLEGVGCAHTSAIVTGDAAVADLPVDDAMVLTNNRYWARTTDWHASVQCPAGQVAVGMCSSGGNPDCYGKTKEILCATRAGGPTVKDTKVRDIYHTFSPEIAFCPNNYVVTEFCSGGGDRDCSGHSLRVRCKPLVDDVRVDYANCEMKESKSWSGRLQATGVNHAMVGVCTSGRNPDCDRDHTVTKSAVFCPLVPAADLAGYTDVFGFYDGKERKLTTNIGENAYGYVYEDNGFRLYSNPGVDRAPLYSCLIGTDSYASRSPKCGGPVKIGVQIGYVSTVDTGVPIYHCIVSGGDRWTTTDKAACVAKGYTVVDELGYAPK